METSPPAPNSRPELAPDAIDWPCRHPPVEGNHRLVAFLYVMLRDTEAPGDIEQRCLNLLGNPSKSAWGLTNPHLEAYAKALAGFLTAK